MSFDNKEYKTLLKEAIANFEPYAYKGNPQADSIIGWDGTGDIPTHKDIPSVGQILERFYFSEDDYSSAIVPEPEQEEVPTPTPTEQEERVAGASDDEEVPGQEFSDIVNDITKQESIQDVEQRVLSQLIAELEDAVEKDPIQEDLDNYDIESDLLLETNGDEIIDEDVDLESILVEDGIDLEGLLEQDEEEEETPGEEEEIPGEEEEELDLNQEVGESLFLDEDDLLEDDLLEDGLLEDDLLEDDLLEDDIFESDLLEEELMDVEEQDDLDLEESTLFEDELSLLEQEEEEEEESELEEPENVGTISPKQIVV